MSEEAVIGRRGSKLQDTFDSAAVVPMRAASGAVVDHFRFRVAAQGFMNETAPLFAAIARESVDSSGLLEKGTLADAIDAATKLATEIARRSTGKISPQPQEIRPFRQAAAQVVAQAWGTAGLRKFDMSIVAAQHAAAFALASEDLDRNVYSEMAIGDEAALAITAANVMGVLVRPVMDYDFRRDRSELINSMTTEVLTIASEALAQIVPAGAKIDERRVVIQTFCQRLAEIMAVIYERKARQVVDHIAGLPEAQKETFARSYNPLPEIQRSFRDWGRIFAGASVACARQASQIVNTGKGEPETSPGRG